MRVLHVSQPVEAGVPNVVIALVADQRRRGDDVHVACPPGPGLAERAHALGATDHPWTATRSLGVSLRQEIRSLRRLIDQIDPDVVVLHSAKAGIAGRMAIRKRRPTVFVPHAWSFEAVDGPLQTATTAWEIVAGRWADMVVCVSEDEQHRGRQAGVASAMEVIPNGIDLDAWKPKPAGPARHALGLLDRPTVVCVGRLAPQKGQDLLLAVWPMVLDAVPDAQLILVGDGPERSALESSAPSGVHFLGARDDIPDLLAAADVVAMPSRWEGGALVTLEAMAAGRPVVAFAVDGMRSTVGTGGLVVEPGDLDGMAKALIGYLTDRDRAAAAGLAAREQVVAVGDLHSNLKRWNDLLTELVRRGPRPASPLQIVPVSSVTRFIAGGARRTTDVATLTGLDHSDALRTAVLSALGVPVWRKNGTPATTTGLGAPTITGPASVEQLARAARRPGALTTAIASAGPSAPTTAGQSELTSAPTTAGQSELTSAPITAGQSELTCAPITAGQSAVASAVNSKATSPGTSVETQSGPPVSIVVTVLNEGDELSRLVEKLRPQLAPSDEIVIVDGGSTDGSVEALAADPALRVEIVPGAGISAGRNHGIRVAANDIIVCTDAGCDPGSGFVDGFRRAFAVDPPALVSGVYYAVARNAMEQAQALACYPQPNEVRRPTLFVRVYTQLFGTGFDPRFAVGRCVAFTRAAWAGAQGFPEHLATGEDVSFGLAVARDGDCLATTDAVTGWNQRDGLAATWRMYRGYGRASTDGGNAKLLIRDSARALAYVVAPVLLTRPRSRLLVGVGAAAYLSLPVARAVGKRAGPATIALLPVALAVKDLGKLAGAVQGFVERTRRAR